jgi:hexosaminidase
LAFRERRCGDYRFWTKTGFSEIYFNTLENKGSWIHLAKSAKIYSADDLANFKLIKEIGKEEIQNAKGKIKLNVGAQNAKYLKLN